MLRSPNCGKRPNDSLIKNQPVDFLKVRKFMLLYRIIVYMPHQRFLRVSFRLTSRNTTLSIDCLYKVPTLSPPFLFCDVIADIAYLDTGCSNITLLLERKITEN